jgi:hypothetical protein
MRRIRSLFAAASLSALGIAAFSPAPGAAEPLAHLAWDDCGAAGALTRTFACNINTGVEQLYISFVPPDGITAFNALEAKIQIFPPEGKPALLPSWWGMFTGGCRQTSLTAPAGFATGPFTCADPWTGSAAGGTAMNATSLSINVVAAVPPGDEHALDPAVEYYGLRVRFNHAKSAGTGACDGCSAPIGLYLSYLKLGQYPSGPDYEYNLSYRGSGVLQYVNWQCDGSPVLEFDFRTGWSLVGWSFPNCVTPTQRQTWGQIKALYR